MIEKFVVVGVFFVLELTYAHLLRKLCTSVFREKDGDIGVRNSVWCNYNLSCWNVTRNQKNYPTVYATCLFIFSSWIYSSFISLWWNVKVEKAFFFMDFATVLLHPEMSGGPSCSSLALIMNISESLREQRHVPCYYDPSDHQANFVLSRLYGSSAIFLSSCMLVGGAIIIILLVSFTHRTSPLQVTSF